ncbi:MMPL family transporter [Desulfococcaceae bacterium HSG8]|nr:MMPL family transporter [Desulfococcaceae bacterium HSG8]
MKISTRITELSVNHYKTITFGLVALMLCIALVAALPSLFPGTFGFLNSVRVDTDPENMLSEEEHVRVFHHEMKEKFALYDIVVVGIVNEVHPEGVFNPDSLRKVYELAEFAKTLRWEEDGKEVGVIETDLIAPSEVDNIEPGEGMIRFEWLMKTPPETQEKATDIRDKALRIPFLKDTLVSGVGDKPGKAVCLYLPITSKDLSYRIYSELNKKIAEFPKSDDKFYITGLPVAEDTFGVEMFIQMAVSAPAAMVVIFILLMIFFHKIILIISPLIVALLSVIFTMGALIIAGFPIHIMSSMIPIFIMPIAVLDSVHIISEFFDRYQETKDKCKTIETVVDELFMPMLYTSMTSAAGFASLAMTPIPPVQVFGVFVATGILAAWFLTIIFIPAYVMFIPEKKLENFGAVHDHEKGEIRTGIIDKIMQSIGNIAYNRAVLVLTGAVILIVIAAYGISQININDNPVKWFSKSHPIRVADKELNKYFAGTYMAYLSLSAEGEEWNTDKMARELGREAKKRGEELTEDFPESAVTVFSELGEIAGATKADSKDMFFDKLAETVRSRASEAEGEASFAWDEASFFVDQQRQKGEVFKYPEVLNYIISLDKVMRDTGVAGKSNSLADVVRTVHRDLLSGDKADYRIPDDRRMVAECLIQYQNSHRPRDLWHFVTSDYRTTSLWVQLKSGDNEQMQKVVDAVDEFVRINPPPVPLKHEWFGLTYINVIWQEKMVTGMLEAFGGSFLVVFLLMTILFRSALWGFLSMIPLTVTISLIYGVIGIVGKDYDMPVAVLSSLTLGLAVDFAIHFLARSRIMYGETLSWEKCIPNVFGEPARAITRNIIVIAAGFLPLLLAPLVPYKTVGILLATILFISGITTLMLLPALIRILEKWLFTGEREPMGATCSCATCIISAIAAVAFIILGIAPYVPLEWTTLTFIGAGIIPVAALACRLLSRRQKCSISE